MISLKNFAVISLDLFQTLVNVESRREHIWKPILQDIFTVQLAEEYARLLLEYFMIHWHELKNTGQFYLIHEVYKKSFTDIFNEKSISFSPSEAVKILFQEHTLSNYFDETVDFLENISQKYKVCIVSDADDAMLPDFHERYGMKLFISEQYHSYKNDEKNMMFKELLKFYNIDPRKVLHIGDSASDIIGANREGIITCWINRDHRVWEHDIKPDYMIESLNEIEEILLEGERSSPIMVCRIKND